MPLPEIIVGILKDSGLTEHYKTQKGDNQDRLDNLDELVNAAIEFKPEDSNFEMNDGSTAVAGEAESQTNLLTKQFTSVTIRLNHYYLSNPNYGYSYDRIMHTAEHELGHAIGLEHTNQVSVMQPAGSYYGIQAQDVKEVQELYDSGE